jgi:hypothetical protein
MSGRCGASGERGVSGMDAARRGGGDDDGGRREAIWGGNG